MTSKSVDVESNDLLKMLKLTKGNLAVDVGKLQQADHVEVIKKIVGKVPRTSYKAPSLGREVFSDFGRGCKECSKKHVPLH